jgi:intron-binding protein aquarius
MLDLISQLPTRRLFHPVFQSQLLVTRCLLSPLSKLKEGRLFNHLVEMLKFYDGFEINNYTGVSLTEDDITEGQSLKVHTLQVIGDILGDSNGII